MDNTLPGESDNPLKDLIIQRLKSFSVVSLMLSRVADVSARSVFNTAQTQSCSGNFRDNTVNISQAERGFSV